MCIDIHAVGLPISILFLHEQIWFAAGNRSLKAEIVCDAFVVNESSAAISNFRVVFPHFVTPFHVDVLSSNEKMRQIDCSTDPYNWMGHFRYSDAAATVEFRSDFCDPTLRQQDEPYVGRILDGEFANPDDNSADGNDDEFLAGMQNIDRAILNFRLRDELAAGATGWLRLKIRPETWPDPAQLVALTGLEFIDGPYEFVAGLIIASPLHLRTTTENKLRHGQWYNKVVEQGWKANGTLVRIEDHRISMIFPDDVQIAHVVNTPEQSLEAIGPTQFESSPGKILLHFATGSNFNRSRDIVVMARRIYDYCDYLRSKNEVATREQLVNRFGGAEHEAIGTLVQQMLDAKVLEVADEAKETITVPSEEIHSRILQLRKNYMFPAQFLKFGASIKDLHPFQISASFRWICFNAHQQRQMKILRELMGNCDDGHENAESRSPPRLEVEGFSG